MSDQDNKVDLFSTSDSVATPTESTDNRQTDQAPAAVFSELLSTITNDKGEPKYRSVEDALKALPHANSFIEQLKKEKEDLIKELERRNSVEDVFEQLKNMQSQPPKTEPPKEDPPSKSQEVDIDALIEAKLQKKAQEDRIKANREAFSEAMSRTFGEKAKEVLETKARELGVDLSTIRSLAESSPVAAIELFKAKTAALPEKTKGTANPAAFSETPAKPTKSVMFGATRSDLLSAWRASKPQE